MTELTADQLLGEASSTSTASSGAGDLVGHLEGLYERLQSDPQLQKAALQIAESNGIDPSLAASLMGGTSSADPDREQPTDVEDEPIDVEATPTPDPEPMKKDITAAKIRDLLNEVADYHPKGEDATIQDLVNYIDENPALVDTAIKMKL